MIYMLRVEKSGRELILGSVAGGDDCSPLSKKPSPVQLVQGLQHKTLAIMHSLIRNKSYPKKIINKSGNKRPFSDLSSFSECFPMQKRGA